jgi:hypothetical protein
LKKPSSPGQCRSEVRGYYDTDSDRVTLVDRGQPFDDIEAVLLLLHEYVHALQRDVPVPPPEELSFDAELALRMVLEGEAAFVADRARAHFRGAAPPESEGYLPRARRSLGLYRLADDPVGAATRTLAYPFGSALVARAFDRRGAPAVARLLRAPPASTRDVLSELELQAARGDARQERWIPVLAGTRLQAMETFGPLVFDGWMHTLARAAPRSTDAAALRAFAPSWGFDELTVLTRDVDQSVLALYRVELNPEMDPDARLEELRALLTGMGRRVWVSAVGSSRSLVLLAATGPVFI